MVWGGMSWHSIKLQNNLLMEVGGSIISQNHLKQDKAKQWMERWPLWPQITTLSSWWNTLVLVCQLNFWNWCSSLYFTHTTYVHYMLIWKGRGWVTWSKSRRTCKCRSCFMQNHRAAMRGTSEAFGRQEVFPCHLVASRPRGLFQASQSPLSSDVAVKLAGKDRFRGYQAETPAVR